MKLAVRELWCLLVKHRILHFVAVGGLCAVVNISVTFTLTSVVGIWYVYSASVAFAVAYGLNFTLQKLWTFQSKTKEGSAKQLVLHFGLQMCNWGMEVGGIYLLVEFVGLWYLYAQIPILGLIAIESYIITRFIFTRKPSPFI